jgi:uroporphyrinogen-III synthase
MGTDVNSTPATPTGPLTAFILGVTAARRRDECVALRILRGARVMVARAPRNFWLDDNIALRRVTDLCPTALLDHGTATTAAGRRGRMRPADGWGRGAGLSAVCCNAVVLTRGPKATGAVRAWAGSDPGEQAVKAVVARLGTSSGPHSDLVRTAPRRGYHLAAG